MIRRTGPLPQPTPRAEEYRLAAQERNRERQLADFARCERFFEANEAAVEVARARALKGHQNRQKRGKLPAMLVGRKPLPNVAGTRPIIVHGVRYENFLDCFKQTGKRCRVKVLRGDPGYAFADQTTEGGAPRDEPTGGYEPRPEDPTSGP